ncbi:MAG TPA: hypothetical protein VHU85_10555 [Acidimicrobiales bacterium]|jgi:hypothetical protein|nr:hypothetical protein [Acidimicrobiales bacterium]
MEKVIYLLWGDGAPGSGDELRSRLLGDTTRQLLDADVRGLGINVHDAEAARAPSPAPPPEGEHPHVAEVSAWFDCYERRDGVEAVLAELELRSAGYLVVESIYDDYGTTEHSGPRDWDDGTRSPGVLTVALIHRPAGLGYAEWIRRWHGTQSPVSGELQPRTRYVRNEVVRPLSDDAPDIDGIVEEAWPSTGHVADPMLFFQAASPEELNANVSRMIESVTACLDLDRLRSSTMSEYLIKSLG